MNQYPFLWLFGVSLVATTLAMPVARRVGVRIGLLDHPHERKLQTSAIPRTGGIGILFGLTVGTILLVRLSGELGIPIRRELFAVVVGGVMIHLAGVLDDLFDLPALAKLGAQSVAVAVVVAHGVILDRIVLPGGGVWELGPLAVPATMFFLLGFINAINLVDGLDGLASGIVGIGALTLAIAGLLDGNYVVAGLSTVVLGSVLGFLPFNLRAEKIFLGDAGSMLLGYLLGVTAIAGVWFSGDSTSVFIGVACALVPILDTGTTIMRRSRNGRQLFRPDSMHIHHRMVRSGLSPRRTVLAILAVTFFAAGQALVFHVEGTRALIVSTTLAAVLAGVQILHRRSGSLAESDSGFREILFYLLGAQDGSGPLMNERIAMADVIAAVQEASQSAEPTAPTRAGDGSAPARPAAAPAPAARAGE